MVEKSVLAHALLPLADDHLILGHRLSQWCGHAPMLEEDLSMPNLALDLIGQARNLYGYCAELLNDGRDEDDLAYLRNERQYRNLLLVERPNGDFGHTMLRQFYFAVFMQHYWAGLTASTDSRLRDFAGKAVKETAYHIRHCGEWVIRLGDGTEESASRMRQAVTALHIYCDEMFVATDEQQQCIEAGILPDNAALRAPWQAAVEEVFAEAFLQVPDVANPQEGGRDGRHTEDLGFLLCELQYMQRAFPGMTW